jgi:hypothetical protein
MNYCTDFITLSQLVYVDNRLVCVNSQWGSDKCHVCWLFFPSLNRRRREPAYFAAMRANDLGSLKPGQETEYSHFDRRVPVSDLDLCQPALALQTFQPVLIS